MEDEKRLIYASEALRMIANSKEDNPFENVRGQGAIWRTAHNSATDCVNACSTVDAIEVVHGRWNPSKKHIWKMDDGEIDLYAYDQGYHN